MNFDGQMTETEICNYSSGRASSRQTPPERFVDTLHGANGKRFQSYMGQVCCVRFTMCFRAGQNERKGNAIDSVS